MFPGIRRQRETMEACGYFSDKKRFYPGLKKGKNQSNDKELPERD